MTPHVHAKEIHAFAEGYEIEDFIPGLGWLVNPNPLWNPVIPHRIKDPYRELKEAAADPTKQIRINDLEWINCGDFDWQFDSPVETYEIRDKPKAKVKMWQWIYKDAAGRCYLSNLFSKDASVFPNAFQRAEWTMIEVEE